MTHPTDVSFETEWYLQAVDVSKRTLGPVYLDEMSDLWFQDKLQPKIIDPELSQGHAIPVATYDSRDRVINIRVEPISINSQAYELAGTDTDAAGDITRVLVGAGVARCAVGWKLLPMKFSMQGHDDTTKISTLIYDDSEPIKSAANAFDIFNGTDLEESIDDLSSEVIGQINILRFAVGAALTHLSNSLRWQQEWAPILHRALVKELECRRADYEFSKRVLDDLGAQKYFDDSIPIQLIALSFPMSPGEEIYSFASQAPPSIGDASDD